MKGLVIVCNGNCGRTTEGLTADTIDGVFKPEKEGMVARWTCSDCIEDEDLRRVKTIPLPANDNLVVKIAKLMFQLKTKTDDSETDVRWQRLQPSVRKGWYWKAVVILKAILSGPNIVEVDPGAELPYDLCPISYKDAEGSVSNNLARAYYGMGMKDLKEKAGWVKPIGGK